MSSGICFSQLPGDILLHILSFSCLLDNVSFSMVCKKTLSLSADRSFWIYALENECLFRPIACAPREDLTKHDLQSLRKIALHTLRLQKNWASETPRIFQPIRTIALGLALVNGFYQIPGTELYIFHILHQKTLELWHTGREARIGMPIEIPATVIDMSSRDSIPGQFLVAVLGRGESLRYQIVVVCVEYGHEDVALKLIFKHNLTRGTKHWCVFLDNDLVGTVCCIDEDDRGPTLCVSALNLSTMKEVLIITDLPSSKVSDMMLTQLDTTVTPTIDGDLYILIVDIPESSAFVVPRSQLHTDNPHFSKISSKILQMEFYSFQAYSRHARDLEPITGSGIYVLKANSRYGIPAMSVVTATANSEPCNFIDVHFWVRSKDPKAPITLLTLPMVIPGFLDFGPQDFWHPAVLTLSGRKAVLLYKVKAEEKLTWVLGLMSCEPDGAEKVAYRNLVIPTSLDMSKIYTLFLDDRMGVVTLLDVYGSLYTISYA